jgi:hypothetical protein
LAAESWTAQGVQQIKVTTSTLPEIYLPFAQSGFESEALCNAFVTAQQALALSNNSTGKETSRKVDADCSLVRDITFPE